MAEINPPLYLQGDGPSAEQHRHHITALYGSRPGVLGSGDLAVTQNGTPNMSVNVAAGSVLVLGGESSTQGLYLCRNTSTVNLPISAAHATNTRYDLVVARVRDAQYSGAVNSWDLYVVEGTPAASPSVPTPPSNSHVLARITIAGADTAINTGDILDVRKLDDYGSNDNGTAVLPAGVIQCLSTDRPLDNLYDGMRILETDTYRHYVYANSLWVPVTQGTPFTYAPTWTQSGSVTYTATNLEYTKNGRNVSGQVYIVATGSGSASNQVLLTAPYNRSINANSAVGAGYFVDVSSGIVYPINVYMDAAARFAFFRTNDESTSPYLGLSGFTAAIASGDILSFQYSYNTSAAGA